jgi:hypothetical protein
VYNPFGVVNCVAKGKLGSQWVDSGCLAGSVLKFSNPREIFEILETLDEEGSIETDESIVGKNISLDILFQKKVPLVELLLQAGYLTLRIEDERWSVCVPNEEVRRKAIPELLWLAIPETSLSKNAFSADVSKAIDQRNMTLLYKAAYTLLSYVWYPYGANESFYRCLFQVAFTIVPGVECEAERMDLLLISNSCRIIIELKLVDPTEKSREKIQAIAAEALAQARGYAVGGRANLIAGWIVNKKTRTLFDLDEYGAACNQFEDLRGKEEGKAAE